MSSKIEMDTPAADPIWWTFVDSATGMRAWFFKTRFWYDARKAFQSVHGERAAEVVISSPAELERLKDSLAESVIFLPPKDDVAVLPSR